MIKRERTLSPTEKREVIMYGKTQRKKKAKCGRRESVHIVLVFKKKGEEPCFLGDRTHVLESGAGLGGEKV